MSSCRATNAKARAPYADATGIMSAWEPIADDVPPTPEPSA